MTSLLNDIYERCAGDVCDVHVIHDGATVRRHYRTALATAREAARLARAGRMHPQVRAFAVAATPDRLPGQVLPDRRAASAALLAAVGRAVRYVPDPVRAELVQAPADLLRSGAGDCEDMAALMAAAAEAVGVPARLLLYGSEISSGAVVFDHLAAQVQMEDGEWVTADPSLPGTPALGRDAAETVPGTVLRVVPLYPDETSMSGLGSVANLLRRLTSQGAHSAAFGYGTNPYGFGTNPYGPGFFSETPGVPGGTSPGMPRDILDELGRILDVAERVAVLYNMLRGSTTMQQRTGAIPTARNAPPREGYERICGPDGCFDVPQSVIRDVEGASRAGIGTYLGLGLILGGAGYLLLNASKRG